MYKIMCWDSVDPRLNVFGIDTYREAQNLLDELEKKYAKYTFQIFEC